MHHKAFNSWINTLPYIIHTDVPIRRWIKLQGSSVLNKCMCLLQMMKMGSNKNPFIYFHYLFQEISNWVCIFSINKNYNEMSFSAWSNFIVINREEYSFAYESNLYMKHIGIAVEQQQQRSHMPITTTFTFNDWVLSRHLSRACVLRAHRPFICCILFHFIFHCEIALRLFIFSVCGWVDTILGYYCFFCYELINNMAL